MSWLLLLALVALAAVAAIIFLANGSSSSSSSILIVGPCGSGKTLLYHRLTTDTSGIETVSSMRKNSGLFMGKENLVDYPGHYRLRGGLVAELKRCRKVVFVVDSAAMAQQSKAAAEILFQVLTSGTTCPLLFICNKTDKATAKTAQRVKLTMMNEIETLRKTANTIESTGGGASSVSLGETGQFFDFDKHSPCPVTFLPFSLKNDDDLAPITQFMTK